MPRPSNRPKTKKPDDPLESPVLENPSDSIDNDPVNHPTHYNEHPSGVECIDLIRYLPFDLGNAFKYVWRRSLKDSTTQDLQKAIWYVKDHSSRVGDCGVIEPVSIPIYAYDRLDLVLMSESNIVISSIFNSIFSLSSNNCKRHEYDLLIRQIEFLIDHKTFKPSSLKLNPTIDHCDLDNI